MKVLWEGGQGFYLGDDTYGREGHGVLKRQLLELLKILGSELVKP